MYQIINTVFTTGIIERTRPHIRATKICCIRKFCNRHTGYPADSYRIVNGGHGGHVVFRCGILDAQRMGMLSQLVRVAPDAVLRFIAGLSCRTTSQKPTAVIGGLPPNYRKQFRVSCMAGPSSYGRARMR